ncbi:MAG: Protein of unknown function (DUF1553)/Protein of unknown function (DUF1549)/Planctomycete [Chthonomonadaceae bacterium]|nr:Protein of unknown function (DUF1553)/Protein of unknown function (DUF1549)/Planctomycete [Chthonomonadaceae bacterium]
MSNPLLRTSLIALLCGAVVSPAVAQKAKLPTPPVAPPLAAKLGETVAAHSDAKETVDPAGVEFFEKKVRPVLAQYCYSCHSASAKRSLGNFMLDSRQGMMHGGSGGMALMPGDPDHSRFIEAVRYAQPELQMPPKGKMSDAVIADLTAWVKMGAPWPKERVVAIAPSPANLLVEKRKKAHWAWQPVRSVTPPAVKRAAWTRNPIDRFILAGLEARNLKPNTYADRRTLIRRASFDLIGLPPTPEEVAAFLADKSPNAWEKVVDRLLASPHYGERWGRYWLDIARYGEDQAHSFEPRLYPQGFRYRDWVANALNADMPYDHFVRAQIAADLIDGPDKKQDLPALGFFATGPVYYGDNKMFDQYDDRIDTLSRGFLGLTVACARCHDHKFDPITQKDYYGLAGIFASTAYIEVPYTPPTVGGQTAENAPVTNRQDMINAKEAEVNKFAEEQLADLRNRYLPETSRYMVAAWKLINRRKTNAKLTTEQYATTEKLETIVLGRWVKYLAAAKDHPALADWQKVVIAQDARTDLSASDSAIAQVTGAANAFQNSLMELVKRRKDKQTKPALTKVEMAAADEIVGGEGVLTIPQDVFDKLLVGDPKVHYATIKGQLDRMKMGPFIHALTEGSKIGNVPVLLRGNTEAPGEEAPRRFLAILAGDNAPTFTKGSGRLELANAVADKNNPLTARVMINRIWQHHFGVGLVRTASNFGLLGEPPTHPELLDYLAKQFMDQGWSMKTMHRQIMLSATYQMSSGRNAHNDEIDPDNRYVWRASRRRLEIEAWRDSMLAVTGQIDLTLGGPSVSLSAANNHRRTFYAAISRHDLDPMLRLFDFPDPNATTDARMATTVPLQQLFVLNSEFMILEAKALSTRLHSDPTATDIDRIKLAYLLVNSRPPTDAEIALGLAFLAGPRSAVAPDTGGGLSTGAVQSAPVPISTKPAAPSAARLTRWEEYSQALLSANELLYVD